MRHVHRDLDRRGRRALARAGLEHPQFAPLDSELHVLHITVMALKQLGHPNELLVDVGHHLLQLSNLERGTEASDDVLALSILQVLAVQMILTGAWVAGEGDAGAAAFTHIAKDHSTDVDAGAPIVGNLAELAVGDGPLAVPRGEHRLDG